jgi:chorismate lyase / 3-hydroxybenzoate synthase
MTPITPWQSRLALSTVLGAGECVSPPDCSRVLAAVYYGNTLPVTRPDMQPFGLSVSTPVLPADATAGGAQGFWHLIHSDQIVQQGRSGAIAFRDDGEFVFGVVDTLAQADGLAAQTCRSYDAIFDFLAQGGLRLWRVWNYLPAINGHDADVERYQHFNAGRQRAYANARSPVLPRDAAMLRDGQIATACGIGTVGAQAHVAGLGIAFLASKRPCLPIENPRQISAFEYPPEYGASSPVFARAIVAVGSEVSGNVGTHSRRFFLSGTASILGHRTCHVGDVIEQCRETLRNITAILDEANSTLSATHDTDLAPLALHDLHYLVYLRDPADMPLVQPLLSQALGAAPVRYVQADICRADLLIEIEAIFLE